MKKKIWAVICLCSVVMTVTGCVKTTELTETEEDVIAEYAASALLRYDEGYNARFQEDALLEAKADAKNNKKPAKATEDVKKEDKKEDKKETPTPEPTPTPTPTPTPETSTPEPTPVAPVQNRMSPYDIGCLFGIEGVEVSYNGFQAADTYPVMDEKQLGFTMEAAQGSKLVVVKFELVNRLDKAKSCNILGQNIKLQMRFNGSDNVAVQKTLLKDDLASFNGELQPGESKTLVVICQVQAGYETTIQSVDLITRIAGENTLINLQ